MRRGVSLLFGLAALAQDGQVAFQGFTGLINTPNALTAPDGSMTYLRSQHTDERWRNGTRPEDYIALFGVFPWLEGSVRLAEVPKPGLRDFSWAGKIKIPGIPEFLPQVAFGIQDVGGAAPNFRTRYAVATQRLGWLDVSLGYGRGPDRMKGMFGGVEARLTSWLDLMAEHDTLRRNVGMRLGPPKGWLPWGMEARLTTAWALNAPRDAFSIGGSLRIPFDLGQGRPRAVAPRPGPVMLGEPAAPALVPTPTQVDPVRVEPAAGQPASLVQRLVALGFENVRVVPQGRILRVEVENNRFNHNALDGIGVALGVATDHAGDQPQRLALVLRKRGLIVQELEAPLSALRAFFQGPEAAQTQAQRQLETSLAVTLGGATTAGNSDAVANGTPGHTSLVFYPGLAKVVGSEVGRFDYQLSLRVGAVTQLWKGAALELGADLPVSHSADFAPGGIFYAAGTPRSRMDRALVVQALPLFSGITTQFGVGKVRYGFDGAYNETHWRSPGGHHTVFIHAGSYRDDAKETRRVTYGTYRLMLPRWDMDAEVTAGRFFNQDEGFRLEFRRWFRDVSLRAFYSDTELKTPAAIWGGARVRMAGMAVGLPLTPRRDMKPGWLQVRGTEQFTEGIRSVVRNPDGRNPTTFGKAERVSTLTGLASLFDQDRLGEAYLRANLGRLREAYRRWGR